MDARKKEWKAVTDLDAEAQRHRIEQAQQRARKHLKPRYVTGWRTTGGTTSWGDPRRRV